MSLIGLVLGPLHVDGRHAEELREEGVQEGVAVVGAGAEEDGGVLGPGHGAARDGEAHPGLRGLLRDGDGHGGVARDLRQDARVCEGGDGLVGGDDEGPGPQLEVGEVDGRVLVLLAQPVLDVVSTQTRGNSVQQEEGEIVPPHLTICQGGWI